MVDIPDTRIVFGSAVRCEMVMGCKMDDSNRREEDFHVRRAVNAINQGEAGKAEYNTGEWRAERCYDGTDNYGV